MAATLIDRLDYGAVGHQAPDPPNGALYVDAEAGDDHADGGINTPLKTLVAATGRVRPAGWIAVYEATGGYPEEIPGVWHKGFVIAGLPGHQVHLRGWEPARNWTRDQVSGMWWHPAPIFDHVPRADGIIDPARNPLATWPEQLWRDDIPLRLVGVDPEGPFEFRMDVVRSRVWIDFDPTLHTMRLGWRQLAFAGSLDGPHPDLSPRYDLINLWVDGYCPSSRQFAAVRTYGDRSRISQVLVTDCAAAGIAVHRAAGVTVDHCTMSGCTQIGLTGYQTLDLDVDWCLLVGNNRTEHAHTGEAGALKLTYSDGALLRHTMAVGNHGHALWVDLHSNYPVWLRNVVQDNDGAGIFMEWGCEVGLALGNLVERNVHGIYSVHARAFDVMYNTCLANQGGRDILLLNPEHDAPPAPWVGGQHHRSNNLTTAQLDAIEAMPMGYQRLLELTEPAQQHRGWFGPAYTSPDPPTPPEEPTLPTVADNLATGTTEAVALIDAQAVTTLNLTIQLNTAQQATALANSQRDAALANVAQQQVTIEQQANLIGGQAEHIEDLNTELADLQTTVDGIVEQRDAANAALAEADQAVTELVGTLEQIVALAQEALGQ